MAHRKAGGTAKNLRDSQPKYLGIKIGDGGTAHAGMVIVRQRGTEVRPGKNVGMGKDHTLFALTTGQVSFGHSRKMKYDGRRETRKIVRVISKKK